MTDLSKLSDADLQAMYAAQKPPADMTDAELMAAFKAQPSTAMDVAKSGGVGVGKGLIQAGGAAGDLRNLVSKGASYLGEKAGLAPETIQGIKDTTSGIIKRTPAMALAIGPTSDEIQSKIEGVTGEFYKPQTRAGRYAETVGEMLPGALVGGPGRTAGQLALKAAKFGLAPGIASEAAGEATAGTAAEPYARVAAALAGTAAPGVGRKIITPFEASPRQAEMVRLLEGRGVDSLTAGQRTGSPVLQAVENKIGNTPGTGFAADRIAGQGEKQFTQAAMRDIGESGMATKPELQAARDRVGGQFDALSSRNSVSTDAQLATDLLKTQKRYDLVLDANQKPIFDRLLGDITDKIVAGGMTGEEYQILRSQLGGKARGLQVSDPEASRAFKSLQKSLDDAMERGLSGPDKEAWRRARDQYGRLKDVEGAVPKSGPALVEGVIEPAALNRSISTGKDASAAARGQLPYSDLAEAGAGVMVPPQRAALQAPSLSGLTLGAPSAVMGRMLMSPAGQRLAGNQLITGPAAGDARIAAIVNALQAGAH